MYLYRQKSDSQQLAGNKFIGPLLPQSFYSVPHHRAIYTILCHGVIDTPLTNCRGVVSPDLVYTIYNDIGLSLPRITNFEFYNPQLICDETSFINRYYQRVNYSIIPEHILTPDPRNLFQAGVYSCSGAFLPINAECKLSTIVDMIIAHHKTTAERDRIINIRCFFCSETQSIETMFDGLAWKMCGEINQEPTLFLKFLMDDVKVGGLVHVVDPLLYDHMTVIRLIRILLDLYETEIKNKRALYDLSYEAYVNASMHFQSSVFTAIHLIYNYLNRLLIHPEPDLVRRYQELKEQESVLDLTSILPKDAGKKKKSRRRGKRQYKK
jgi:hypothetical protein